MSDEQTAFIITGNITTDAALAEILRLRAENARLRAALKEIEMLWFNDDSGAQNSRDAFVIARNALTAAAALKETGE